MLESNQKQKDSNSGMVETDSSLNDKPSQVTAAPDEEKKHSKKRIGQYYYYLSRVIGSGYSSTVYEGYKNGDKTTKYAIKAINLEGISKANYKLLQNEIKIIRELDHPNIVKCYDVLFTKHNYYIILEYCESGNLQRHIQSNFNIQWNQILFQICQGCSYLNSKRIVHRDIKPANIFCRNGEWKIGDFGFACFIGSENETSEGEVILKEKFTIGSPLYMPPESLIDNVYSLKTDAFALGVLMYYTTTKEFPWLGTNKEVLIENYKTRDFPENHSKFKELSNSVRELIKSLCCKDMQQRASISECNFQILLSEKSDEEIKSCMMKFKDKYTEQVTFAQFIYYLYLNMKDFLPENQILFTLVACHLDHLTRIYSWDSNNSLKKMKQKYQIPSGITEKNLLFQKSDYKCLEKKLLDTSKALLQTGEMLNIVGAQKMLEYRFFLKVILRADFEFLQYCLKKVQVHTNFKGMLPDDNMIDEFLAIE